MCFKRKSIGSGERKGERRDNESKKREFQFSGALTTADTVRHQMGNLSIQAAVQRTLKWFSAQWGDKRRPDGCVSGYQKRVVMVWVRQKHLCRSMCSKFLMPIRQRFDLPISPFPAQFDRFLKS